MADLIFPLALVVQSPFVLVVNQLPVHSVKELVAHAKENPGKLSFASVGPGVPHHLFAELFKSMTGIAMTHVPYKGNAGKLNDLVAGHIPLMFTDLGPAVVGMLQVGQIRPLGVSTRTRLAAFADIPPIADSAPGFAASWQMIVAPAATRSRSSPSCTRSSTAFSRCRRSRSGSSSSASCRSRTGRSTVCRRS